MRINDQSIGIGEVVPPQGPQFLLAADIPHSEHYILVLNLLNIETYNMIKGVVSLNMRTNEAINVIGAKLEKKYSRLRLDPKGTKHKQTGNRFVPMVGTVERTSPMCSL